MVIFEMQLKCVALFDVYYELILQNVTTHQIKVNIYWKQFLILILMLFIVATGAYFLWSNI